MNIPDGEFQPDTPVYKQIVARLRHAMMDGSLPPGTRLPSARELAGQLNASYLTVHKALSILTREGLLERCSNRGTFVKGTRRLVTGILCGPDLNDETAHFYRKLTSMLQNELKACGENAGTGLSARIYDKLFAGMEGLSRLKEDMEGHAFGAWITIDIDFASLGLPEKAAKLPSVNLVRPAPDIAFDLRGFAYESAGYLYAKGCRKIVFLAKSSSLRKEEFAQGFEEAARKHGSALPFHEYPHKWPCEGAGLERSAHQATLALLDGWRSADQMPDAIIADDDIAMRGIALALIKRNVQIPALTLANEGIAHHYGIPAIRYEMPIGQLVSNAVGLLWRRICGERSAGRPISLKGCIKESLD